MNPKEEIGLMPIAEIVDRNYYNSVLKELLSERVPLLVMPKKGKKNEKEQKADFQKYRRKHSAIESNINALEYRRLDKCPDKGIEFQYIRLFSGLRLQSSPDRCRNA